ncbi:MAG: response regulator [candidate division Zixibacteria bacterium]|nr:response regulator [candidate division Zixibacteria bacterium]
MSSNADKLNKPVILVVDDEEIMRNVIAKMLKGRGYEIETADSTLTALELLKSRSFDLVISDVQMPGRNGFELLKEVKQTYPEIVVIMMTGHSDTYTIKDALMLGAEEYIAKPFKHYEVTAVVERALLRREVARAQN